MGKPKKEGNLKNEISHMEYKEAENRISENKIESIKDNGNNNLKITNKDVEKPHSTICDKETNNKLQDNIPIILETKKHKKEKKNGNDIISLDVIDEENEDDSMSCFSYGERLLAKDERVVAAWSF